MGGRHYKNPVGANVSEGGNDGRSNVSARSSQPVTGQDVPRPQADSGAGRSGSSDPGETAMFIAMHEQSKKRSAAATSGRMKPSEIAAISKGEAKESAAASLPPLDSADPGIGKIDAPVDDAGDHAFSESGTEFAGSGAKEDFYDFNLPYGTAESSAGLTSDGLVRHKHRKKRKGKIVRNCVLGLIAALVVVCAISGFALYQSVKNVQNEVKSAISLVSDIKGKVTSGDFASLSDDVDKISETCSSIKKETDGPLWTMATFVPVYGSDVSAARTLIAALSDVATNGLSPMATELSKATPGKLIQAGGTINISALQAVVNSMADAADVFERANDEVQGIGTTHIDKVSSLVKTAKDGFAALDGATSAAVKFAPVLPQMLGANGQTRNYLVVAENNVEIRACGGFGGSQGLISITDGHLSIGDFVKVITRSSDEAVDSVDEEDETLFGAHSGLTSSGNTYSPDWPRNSMRIAELWKAEYDQDVDGVIALDPVFLQYLLSLTGGVSLPDGTSVDGSNAAKVLMHDVYWNYPVEESDAIFASVAGSAFNRIVNAIGDVDFSNLFNVIGRGISEGRFIAWMRSADEQKAIKGIGMDASLPDPDNPAADPVAGVYFDNLSFSKLDWYLDAETTVGSGIQSGDGTCSYRMQVKLTNTMTEEEAANLPDYVAASAEGAPRDDERLYVILFAPTGGSISDLNIDGTEFNVNYATWHGVPFACGTVDLRAGQSTTVTYTLTTSSKAGEKALTLRQTPTCQIVRGDKTK